MSEISTPAEPVIDLVRIRWQASRREKRHDALREGIRLLPLRVIERRVALIQRKAPRPWRYADGLCNASRIHTRVGKTKPN